MEARITIEGEDVLLRTFERLPEQANRAAHTCIDRIVRFLVAPLRAAAPFRSGRLRDSIDAVTRDYFANNLVMGLAGPGWPDGAVGSIVEKGSPERATRDGHRTGVMPATPFVETVFADYESSIDDQLAESLGPEIERRVGP